MFEFVVIRCRILRLKSLYTYIHICTYVYTHTHTRVFLLIKLLYVSMGKFIVHESDKKFLMLWLTDLNWKLRQRMTFIFR